MTTISTPEIAKGRGRPSNASKGLTAKRQYVRTITPEVLAIRRIGEGLWGRNWQVDFHKAVKFNKGMITRVLVGTAPIPADMDERILAAGNARIEEVRAALNSPLLTNETVDVRANAEAVKALGEQVWGSYWRSDFASSTETDAGLLSNALSNKRELSVSSAAIQLAIRAQTKRLEAVMKDAFLRKAKLKATKAAKASD